MQTKLATRGNTKQGKTQPTGWAFRFASHLGSHKLPRYPYLTNMRRDFEKDLLELQNGYRLVQPQTGYYFALVLAGHGRALGERYTTDHAARLRRKRRGLPNFKLLHTSPPVLLANVESADALADESTHLADLGYQVNVVDLRQGWVQLERFSFGSVRGVFMLRPARAVVEGIKDTIKKIGEANGRNFNAVRAGVNQVLAEFQNAYRWTNAGGDFAGVQAVADHVLLKSLAVRDNSTIAKVKKRYCRRVTLGNVVAWAVVVGSPAETFTLRLAKFNLKYRLSG